MPTPSLRDDDSEAVDETSEADAATDDLDDWDDFEDDTPGFERFKDPRQILRQARKRAEAAQALTDDGDGLTAAFVTTYQPSRHEAGWLRDSLRPFTEQSLIDDVLFAVKGGKEASVYCCKAHPAAASALGVERLAAKVYRPRMFRNLRNDAMYREGRAILTEDGRAVKNTDHRILRAVGKKTDFGAAVQHQSWLLYEYTTLQTLWEKGAAVPRPVAVGENAILMSYHGDDSRGAPTLVEVDLTQDEARKIFDDVRRTLAILLAEGVVHGDLSPYNILYHDGAITFIDFPQVVRLGENPHADAILTRDLTRVCDFFSRMGIPCDPTTLRHELTPPPPDDRR